MRCILTCWILLFRTPRRRGRRLGRQLELERKGTKRTGIVLCTLLSACRVLISLGAYCVLLCRFSWQGFSCGKVILREVNGGKSSQIPYNYVNQSVVSYYWYNYGYTCLLRAMKIHLASFLIGWNLTQSNSLGWLDGYISNSDRSSKMCVRGTTLKRIIIGAHAWFPWDWFILQKQSCFAQIYCYDWLCSICILLLP